MSLPYWGAKYRIGKDIASVIAENVTREMNYAEPFCGMCNVGIALMKLPEDKYIKTYYFSDKHPDLIIYLKAINEGWLPSCEPVTIQKWLNYKNSKRRTAQRAFYGFALGFNGLFLMGTKPKKIANNKKYLCNKRERLKQLQPFFSRDNISIKRGRYLNQNYENTLIYADPPYVGARYGWNEEREFEFWKKVGEWLQPGLNNIVFVSAGKKPKKVYLDKCGLSVKLVWKKKTEGWHTGVKSTRTENLYFVRNK